MYPKGNSKIAYDNDELFHVLRMRIACTTCTMLMFIFFGIKFNDVKFNVWKILPVKMTDGWND